MVFDEFDNGMLSEGFKDLNLNKHFDDVNDDELDVNDLNKDKNKIMQDPIQSLVEVEEKQVERIEDSQPDLETQSHDFETALERTDLSTPIRDFQKKVGTSFLNDYTPSILRRKLRLSSQHLLENILSDPNKGTQTRSSHKHLCAFSAFVSLVEPKYIKETL